jgi:hypothetical protein
MNIELIEIKDFSSFARVLRKFDYNVDSSASFIRKLFNKSVDEYVSTQKDNPVWAKEAESYSPFDSFLPDTLTRYYTGKLSLSPKTCRQFVSYLNRDNFLDYFDSLNTTDEIESELIRSISKERPNVNSDNVGTTYCSYFFETINTIASSETHIRKRKIVPKISPFCSADTEADFEERIIKAIKNITHSCDKDFDDKDINPPYKIREKVKDKHLCDELEVEVKYFPLINSALVNAENNSGKPSEYICSTVNRHFIRLENQKLSEREIVKRMQQFFATKAAVEFDSPECRTLTVYFIQLCEVFRGPSR